MNDKSKNRLATCCPVLQDVFNEVDRRGLFNLKVLEGHRTSGRQAELYEAGKSQIRVGGKHTETPSRAIDIIPLQHDGTIDWKDRELFTLFAGYVLGVADSMGATLRWGGDWNSNKNLKDNSFDDLVHFEEM